MSSEKKIYMTTFTAVRYFRANSEDEAKAALAKILKDDIENADNLNDVSLEQVIVVEDITSSSDITEDMIENADDYLTGA